MKQSASFTLIAIALLAMLHTAPAEAQSCVPSSTRLCLQNNRFSVTINWLTSTSSGAKRISERISAWLFVKARSFLPSSRGASRATGRRFVRRQSLFDRLAFEFLWAWGLQRRVGGARDTPIPSARGLGPAPELSEAR